MILYYEKSYSSKVQYDLIIVLYNIYIQQSRNLYIQHQSAHYFFKINNTTIKSNDKKNQPPQTHPQNQWKTISEATRGRRMHRCDAPASLGTKLHSVGNPPPEAHLRPHRPPPPLRRWATNGLTHLRGGRSGQGDAAGHTMYRDQFWMRTALICRAFRGLGCNGCVLGVSDRLWGMLAFYVLRGFVVRSRCVCDLWSVFLMFFFYDFGW